MGESACLMQQPFCYASGIHNDASNESNPIHALGQSVSFGRFMSESLAWEKWSSFSSNPKRYVEEAERYSRPGSVAQKKAFFEAHYKKLAAKKAAALLEQQANNAGPNNVSEQEHEKVVDNVKSYDSQMISPESKLVVSEEQDLEAQKTEPDATICNNGYNSNSSSNMQTDISDLEKEQNAFVENSMNLELPKQLEDNDNYKAQKTEPDATICSNGYNSHSSSDMQTDISDPEKEQKAFVEDPVKVELPKQLEDNDNYKEIAEEVTRTPPVNKWMLKKNSNSDQEVLASMSKKNPSSSSKLLKDSGTPKYISTPAKSVTPISSNKDKFGTPMSKKPGLSSADKKRATPKSLHMPVNFTPIRELNRLTASVMRRFESSRVVAASKASSKDSSTPLKTPTVASKNELHKHASMNPLMEKKRNKTPMDPSVSVNNAAGPTWRLLSAEKKVRSPIITSPFSLRTEERAATRKKKLEEKFNANVEQKVQLHTKLKQKAETEIRKLRQSFCFKARPLPEFYKERKASKNEINKETMLYPESLKQGRKLAPGVVESKTSLPPQRPSLKNNGTKIFQGKNNEFSSHLLTSNSTINTTHENTSPNIQHGNRNDRYFVFL